MFITLIRMLNNINILKYKWLRQSTTYLCHVLSYYEETPILLYDDSKQLHQVIVP